MYSWLFIPISWNTCYLIITLSHNLITQHISKLSCHSWKLLWMFHSFGFFVRKILISSTYSFLLFYLKRNFQYLWKLSTILSWPLRSFFVRWSSILASTRHSMKVLRYWGSPRLGNHSFPIHSWFISPNANVWNEE